MNQKHFLQFYFYQNLLNTKTDISKIVYGERTAVLDIIIEVDEE